MPRAPAQLRRGGRLSRRRSGQRGEEIAARYLQRRGYELVERNFRTRRGEIDLVMRDGETLVFVEVKFRRGAGYGDPLEAVTPRKRAKIRTLALEYLSERRTGCDSLRFDVVGILADSGGYSVEHIEDAF